MNISSKIRSLHFFFFHPSFHSSIRTFSKSLIHFLIFSHHPPILLQITFRNFTTPHHTFSHHPPNISSPFSHHLFVILLLFFCHFFAIFLPFFCHFFAIFLPFCRHLAAILPPFCRHFSVIFLQPSRIFLPIPLLFLLCTASQTLPNSFTNSLFTFTLFLLYLHLFLWLVTLTFLTSVIKAVRLMFF